MNMEYPKKCQKIKLESESFVVVVLIICVTALLAFVVGPCIREDMRLRNEIKKLEVIKDNRVNPAEKN